MEKREILQKVWFTSMLGTVGVVLIKNYDGHKAYIAPVDGKDEDEDARKIARFGARFPATFAIALFPHIKSWSLI